MAESKIEWTDRSDWNPVRGCSRVSPGCGGPGPHGGCYAEAMAARFSKPGQWGHGFAEMKDHKPRWTGKVELQEDRLLIPLSWRKPARVFPNSTSDFFHEALPFTAIDKLFASMAMCPHLTFQVLTKRPERMLPYMSDPLRRNEIELAAERLKASVGTPLSPKWSFAWPLPNVWLGVSAERQKEADERIPLLLQTPAAVRFVSCEPLLGPIDLTRLHWKEDEITYRVDSLSGRRGAAAFWPGATVVPPRNPPLSSLDWVIVGGESGPNARPMHPDWARSLRVQCAAAGVPFFFKQWGEFAPVTKSGAYTEAGGSGAPDIAWPDGSIAWGKAEDHGGLGTPLARVGKKSAGRTLDSSLHSEMPRGRG